MLAKVIKNSALPGNRRQSFHVRITYTCAKAAKVALCNVAGESCDAPAQMEYAALLNERVTTPVCHIQLSWSETETHSDQEMIAAARIVLKNLGAQEYQAAIAVHRDRPSPHVHLIVNRVHPMTGIALSLSHSHARLELACRRVEHRMGWPPDRGRFDVEISDGKVYLCPKPAEHWARKKEQRALGLRSDGRAVRGHHLHNAMGYLRDDLSAKVIAQARNILDTAHTWDTVHAGLRKIGLAYQRYRSGARILEIDTGRIMPASQLSSRHSWPKMFKRLGELVASPVSSLITKHRKESQKQARIAELRRSQDAECKLIRTSLNGDRSPICQALRSTLHDKHKAERTHLRKELAKTGIEREDIPHDGYAIRYRDAGRHRQSALELVDDHTARRQKWMLSPLGGSEYDLPSIIPITASSPDTVRSDGDGGLLFAKRNIRGDLLGYQHLLMPTVSPDISTECLHAGICGIGLPSAKSCILVAAPSHAIRHLLDSKGPAPFVIILGNKLDETAIEHIAQITATYDKICVDGPQNFVGVFRQTLQDQLSEKHIAIFDPLDASPDDQPHEVESNDQMPDDDLLMP